MNGPGISVEELQLAARNHGMPLEGLRYDITPAGLHYLLTHYDIPAGDPATWRLEIGGAVERSLELSIEDLRARPSATLAVTLECAGNGRARLDPRPISQPWLLEAVGTAEWTGTTLGPVLREAGASPDALEVRFDGLDRGVEHETEQAFQRSLSLGEAMRNDVLLVYAMNGSPLLPQHGAPLRLVVPGWYGFASVKWLRHIEVLTQPFEGYQQSHAYRMRYEEDEPGTPLSRIRPRSLMIPPGMPEFLTRTRILDPGPCLLEGRAWSGVAPIARVEVSLDGGTRWQDAGLDPLPTSAYAWRRWTFSWDAKPGEHELCCRATDAVGETQPLEPEWNVGGYANNAVQRLPVTVRARPDPPTMTS